MRTVSVSADYANDPAGLRADYEKWRSRTTATDTEPLPEVPGIAGTILRSPPLMKALTRVLPDCGDDDDQRSFARSLSGAMGAELPYRGQIVSPDGLLIARTWGDWMVKRHGVPAYGQQARRGGPLIGSNPDPEAIERGYVMAMRAVHKGRVPSIGDVYRQLLEEAFAWDVGRKEACQRALGRMLCRQVPWYDADDRSVRRTGAEGLGGPTYGFTVHPVFANRTMDRARTTDGPWARCNWVPVPGREYWQPIFNETSAANGSQFGGLTAWMGLGETYQTPVSDGKLGGLELVNERLVVQCNVSRDLLRDTTERIAETLDYISITTIRRGIESQMILGNMNEGGVPIQVAGNLQGAITAGSTVIVGRTNSQTSNTVHPGEAYRP